MRGQSGHRTDGRDVSSLAYDSFRLAGAMPGSGEADGLTWSSTRSRPVVVWRFMDDKPGHLQQSGALIRAMARKTLLEVMEIPVKQCRSGMLHWLAGRWRIAAEQEYPAAPPDVLIGAGHRTHLPMLMSRQAFGGKVVVLMKPSLPMAAFDTVVLPEHDGVPAGGNRILSNGTLNSMRPMRKSKATGILLVGGPGKHFLWDEDLILAQVKQVMEAQHDVEWLIADSRRTPAEFSSRLSLRFGQRFMSHAQCPSGWLAHRLGTSTHAWVTEDSMSMIYEALSAGCDVGLLRLRPARESRIVLSTRRLVMDARVRTLEQDGKVTAASRAEPLNEADRIATLLLREWGLLA